MTVYHYLIIGNGAAGMSAAEMIRRRDPSGQITIVTNEPYLFYSRPGIAYYIMDQIPESQLITRSDSFYRSHRLNLHFGHVSRLDLEAKLVFLDDGQPLAYDVLLLATGATAVPASFPGAHLEGVLTFDTLDDAKRVIKQGRGAKTAVVVGGGITAMELAEGLNHQGARTLLLQRGDRVWPRLFDERESAIVESQIRHEGITVLYNEEITEIVGKRGKVAGVRLKSGRAIKCQVVAVAIGVRPNMSLVEDLAIEKDKGILVNDFLQSSQPSLFAAGDVAQIYDRWTGQHQLDILWPSAINEGRAAGNNMVDLAHGKSPSFNYRKGSPFNCALLFGLHLTVIGRVGTKENGKVDELQYLSRGSSHIWTAPFTTRTRSAWDKDGLNSLRIVMAEGQIVGALLIGNQELADPLRRFIEQEVDLSTYESQLTAGHTELPQTLLKAWNDWHQRWS
jgi:NADPH-dependent 2,4-dienoyl-CoA reductase/sulfur reductase-like enzyme